MANEEFDRLLSERHKDFTLFDLDGKKVPCIILDEKKFDDMMRAIAGKLDFFESLADTSMLALSSPHSQYGSSNVFMIQLPRAERTLNALEIIRKGLKV